MTTPPHDPLDPLATSDASMGETTPLDPSPYASVQSDKGHSSSTADTAKDEAKNVKDAAAGATQQVADTAKEQAGQVASDVREQTRQLADETRNQLSSQVTSQRDRAVGGLRSLGDELRTMSEQSGQSGVGTQLAREGGDITHKVADFIEQREPAQLLDEVRSYARQKPGTFLIGAAVAGALVGRLTRGAVAARQSDDDAGSGIDSHHTGYDQTTSASYLGTPADLTSVEVGYSEVAPAYGSPQMDQLAYPADSSDYATDTGAYVPEEPGAYDIGGEQPSTTYPPEQGYRS